MSKQLLVTNNIEFGHTWKNADAENRKLYTPQVDWMVLRAFSQERFDVVYIDMSMDMISSTTIAKLYKRFMESANQCVIFASLYNSPEHLNQVIRNVSSCYGYGMMIWKIDTSTYDPVIRMAYMLCGNLMNVDIPLKIEEGKFAVGNFVYVEYSTDERHPTIGKIVGRIGGIIYVQEMFTPTEDVKCINTLRNDKDIKIRHFDTEQLDTTPDKAICGIIKGEKNFVVGILNTKLTVKLSDEKTLEYYTVLGTDNKLYLDGLDLAILEDMPEMMVSQILTLMKLEDEHE